MNTYTVKEVIGNIDNLLVIANDKELRDKDARYYRWNNRFYTRKVCNELNIFDWWSDYLSVSQLKAMRSFLIQAEKLGYNGYCCFKVGSVGCSNGMWAYKELSTDGYSPKGEFLYHSFVSDDNHYEVTDKNGFPYRIGERGDDNYKWKFTLKEIKEYLKSDLYKAS